MNSAVTRSLRLLLVTVAGCALALMAVRVTLAQASGAASAAQPSSPRANPVVNVAHFAPFGADVSGTSVTVRINGSDVFTDFVYGEIITGVNVLPAGTYTIEVLPTGSSSVAISGVVTLADDSQYTLVAGGDGSNQPLQLFALLDDTTAPAAGSAKLRVGHYAPFAATLADTRVDICNDATGTALPGLTDVPFGVASSYLTVPAGVYDLSIAVAGTNCATVALDLPAIAAASGQIYDVFAIGKNNATFPLEVTSVTGLDSPARVTVGHFAPFAAAITGTLVDIRVNGSVAFTDVAYGDFVPDVQLLPGSTLVEILPAGTNTVALSSTFNLQGGTKVDLFAIGGANSQPLAFSATPISTTPPLGKALITIGHLAPFAADVNATAVDICTDAGVALLSNVKYPQVAANLPLDPGVYDLKIAIAGTNCGTVALDLPAISLAAGKVYDVFAIGLNNAAFPLEIASTTGLDVAAHVTIGHFAPFAADVAGTAVDIRVNGTTAYTNVVYGDFVANVALPPGPTLVEILPAGTSTVALSGTVDLQEGAAYDLFAIGGANSQPLAFSTTEISRTAPAGKALVTIGHLAPFAANLADTAVDICTDSGVALPGLTGVEYGQVAANLALDPGPYDLKISIAGDNCVTTALDLPRFRLFAGEIADVFAIGLGTPVFPLDVVSTTGLNTVESFLPIIARGS